MAYRRRDTESQRFRWQIPDRGIHGKVRMERNDPVRQFATYRESALAFHRHCEQSPGRRALEWKLDRAVALRSYLGFDPRARQDDGGRFQIDPARPRVDLCTQAARRARTGRRRRRRKRAMGAWRNPRMGRRHDREQQTGRDCRGDRSDDGATGVQAAARRRLQIVHAGRGRRSISGERRHHRAPGKFAVAGWRRQCECDVARESERFARAACESAGQRSRQVAMGRDGDDRVCRIRWASAAACSDGTSTAGHTRPKAGGIR